MRDTHRSRRGQLSRYVYIIDKIVSPNLPIPTSYTTKLYLHLLVNSLQRKSKKQIDEKSKDKAGVRAHVELTSHISDKLGTVLFPNEGQGFVNRLFVSFAWCAGRPRGLCSFGSSSSPGFDTRTVTAAAATATADICE